MAAGCGDNGLGAAGRDWGTARVVETHLSLLFLVGDRVYKLRKPVRFGFVDLSERRAREIDCHREVELNRRLAPDVYLGVLDIVEAAAGGAQPRPVDHLVVMRRLPDDRRLSTLVRSMADLGGCLHATARLLARFHAAADRSPEIDRAATPEAVAKVWEDNFSETARFVGSALDASTERDIQRLVRAYLDGRGPLLARRIREGWICDGHGDLQAEDIFCTAEGPKILDCLEFDDRLRHGDVLADLSFLVMDLERLGSPVAAAELVKSYQEFTATALPASLLHHYCAARAYVRTKVTCLRQEQAGVAATEEARALHGLCRSFLERSQVRLVLVGGLPGTGKSTLARRLADHLGATLLRSDEVRKELAGIPDGVPAAAAYRQGLYTGEITERTYQTMLERAAVALGLGLTVVLDATFASRAMRDLARGAAVSTASRLVELRCFAPSEVTAQRIAARRSVARDPSDATAEVARAMAADFEAWPSATVIDTSASPAEALTAAQAVVDP